MRHCESRSDEAIQILKATLLFGSPRRDKPQLAMTVAISQTRKGS